MFLPKAYADKLIFANTTKPSVPTKPDEQNDVESPETGDNSHIVLLLLLMCISSVGLGTTFFLRKHYNEVKK